MDIQKVIIGIVSVFFAALVIGLLGAWPVELAINYVFDPKVLIALFGVSQMTFWKTYWLCFVTSAVFKSTVSPSTSSSE